VARGNTRQIIVTVSNAATHHQTRLSFPGPTVSRTEFQKFIGNNISSLKVDLRLSSLPGWADSHFQRHESGISVQPWRNRGLGGSKIWE
jgi:hypothetical protein